MNEPQSKPTLLTREAFLDEISPVQDEDSDVRELLHSLRQKVEKAEHEHGEPAFRVRKHLIEELPVIVGTSNVATARSYSYSLVFPLGKVVHL